MLKRIERLTSLLNELHKILSENKGQNYLPGVNNILRTLNNSEVPLDERFKEAKDTFRHMMGGAGTLKDFIICEGPILKANPLDNHFREIQNEIWELLDCGLSNLPSVDEGYPPGNIYWTIKDSK
jgi:hypothetical protein